jgi:hypothetical protein
MLASKIIVKNRNIQTVVATMRFIAASLLPLKNNFIGCRKTKRPHTSAEVLNRSKKVAGPKNCWLLSPPKILSALNIIAATNKQYAATENA